MQEDYALFKSALLFSVTLRAVDEILETSETAVLPLVVTTGLLTMGAKLLAQYLSSVPAEGHHPLIYPIYRASAFIALTFVSVGIQLQSNLIGTYLSRVFAHETHPFFILIGATIGLVLLWLLGVIVGAN